MPIRSLTAAPSLRSLGARLTFLVAVAVAVSSAAGCGAPGTDDIQHSVVHQGLAQAGPVQVGFNAPEGLTDPLGDDLVEYIDGTAVSLDVALYKLTHLGAVDALLRANTRGVVIRMVSDTKHRDLKDAGPVYDELEAAGIPIVYDERMSDMHNKFLVRDGLDVWLGSYNPLQRSSTHAEDALTITSEDLATAYTTEFEEMFVDHLFTRAKTDNTEHEFFVDGVRVEAYFSPSDGVRNRMVEAIEQAQHSVRFLAFSFSSDPIADAMLARMDDGLEVMGAVDNLQVTKRGGDFTRMLAAGMDIRRAPFLTMMHHKFLVIDAGTEDAKVITGSFNFTAQADERNDENIVIIHSSETAFAYLAAFNLVFERCARLNADGEVGQNLRITEVHANAVDERTGEFVEIVNASDETVSLLGLYLFDGDAWDRVQPADGGPASLGPWQVAVILDRDYDGVTPPVAVGARRFTVENGTLGDGLTNNDPISIYGSDRQVAIDTFSFPSNPGNGKSIYRVSADAADVAESWVQGRHMFGTAGIYPEPVDNPWGEPDAEVEDAAVDVNIASESELTRLPGVGPTTAANIAADRTANGWFCSLDDLARVSGIGPVTVERLRPHATVGAELPVECSVDDGQEDALVDVNTADAATLDTLPGIGPSTAAAMIADRQANGPFCSLGAMTRIRGVGLLTVSRIRPHATVGDENPPGCLLEEEPGGNLIDINSADVVLLDTLPGIGPTTARRIVADRAANGAFPTTSDITRVWGVGAKTYSAIAFLISAL